MWGCWYDGQIRKESPETAANGGPVLWLIESVQFRLGAKEDPYFLWF
jgi:hypothetical protein